MNHFFRLIFSLSFAAFMVASAGQSSNAAPAARQQSAKFDGLWSVAIVTLQALATAPIGIQRASRAAASCRPMPIQAIASTVL